MNRPRTVISLLIAFLLIPMVSAQTFVTPQELADDNGAFIEVNNAEIYYVSAGDPDDPAVMLIHGFGGSTFTWRDNLGVLAEAGYYAVALDLPPFGLSEKDPDLGMTRRDYAGYVVGLMDALDIERAAIVGHSMGGSVTAYVAEMFPERVSQLVFVAGGVFEGVLTEEDTGGGDSPFAFLNNINPESESAIRLLQVSLRPTTFGQIISSAYYDEASATDEVIAGYARPLQIETWAAGFLGYLQVEESDPITLDELAEAAADIPTLIIWGENDTWVPFIVGETMQDTLANSQVVTYAVTGHLPMEENTAQFNADLIAFLNDSRE